MLCGRASHFVYMRSSIISSHQTSRCSYWNKSRLSGSFCASGKLATATSSQINFDIMQKIWQVIVTSSVHLVAVSIWQKKRKKRSIKYLLEQDDTLDAILAHFASLCMLFDDRGRTTVSTTRPGICRMQTIVACRLQTGCTQTDRSRHELSFRRCHVVTLPSFCRRIKGSSALGKKTAVILL